MSDTTNKDVDNYRYLLKDLTHRSKPLITSLTQSLREHYAPASLPHIAAVIVQNLKESPHVVPALYLVDSVIKNLGALCTRAMVEHGLGAAFVAAYRRSMRGEDRKEIQRVFLTWTPTILPASLLQEINEALSPPNKKRPVTTNNYQPERISEDVGKKPRTNVSPNISPAASPLVLDLAQLSKLATQLQPHRQFYSLPRQCANCGLRFPETEVGREAHRIHLDGHFRRKARIRQRTKRVLARDWFLPAEAWITSSFSTLAASDQEHADKSAYFQSPILHDERKQEAEEEASVVPAGEDPQNTSCAQCNEPMPATWDDESESWVFRGAKLNPEGLPCHAYCL